jgi:tetratricopeptide (TPR) repeat protein
MIRLLTITFVFCFGVSIAQKTNEFKLANQYYKNGDCEKAVTIYNQFKNNGVNELTYYSNLLECLIQLENYKEAFTLVKRIKTKYPNNPKYIADLGFVYKAKGDKKLADRQFDKSIKKLKSGKVNDVNLLANKFYNNEEYSWSQKTYEAGQKLNPSHEFGFSIANNYRKMGETSKMIEAYLDLITKKSGHLSSVQVTLQNILGRTKGTDDNFDLLQKQLMLRIQKNNNTALTELLVWLLMESEDYKTAFIYSKALDKRLKEKGARIFELGLIAHENENFNTAIRCYTYIIGLGIENSYYLDAEILEVIATSEKILASVYSQIELENLDKKFENLLLKIGENIKSSYLMKEHASLNAFYINDLEKAKNILEKCIDMNSENEIYAECKLMLADIKLIEGLDWESILLYSQVEKSFKENAMGHEAKLRRAKVSYYQGQFDWAQAQLDVLKASTSKLISNNAMKLSLFITDNLGLDTSETAMQMYARAELLVYQNKYSESISTLDSISTIFSGHTLIDDVLYQKAMIYQKQQKYDLAIQELEAVATNYQFDILADDALFKWAEILDYQLVEKEKAKNIYEKILTEHNGSIYTAKARERFRELRQD